MSPTDDAKLVVESGLGPHKFNHIATVSADSWKAAVRLATAYIEAGRVDGGDGCPACGARKSSAHGWECGTVLQFGGHVLRSWVCNDRQIANLTARLATVQEELDRLTVMCSLTDKDRHVLLQERVAIRELIGIEPFDDDTPIIEAIRELKRKAGGE